MTVKKLSKLSAGNKTTAPAGVVGSVHPEEMRWKAEEAMRTIHRAEEHKKDRPLMKEVKKLVKSHVKACGVK